MRWIPAVLFVFPFALATPVGATGADVETYTESIWVNPDGLPSFVPCAAGGAGEYVVLDGAWHWMFHYTLPANFAGNLVEHYNFANTVAVGETTGTVYRNAASYRFVTTFEPGDLPRTYTAPLSILFIGPGRAHDFRMHLLAHTTINANGEVTSSVDVSHVTCD